MHKHTHNVANLRQVDIIRDVTNLAQVHFAACMFALPLKTADNPKGTFTAPQLWEALTALYSGLHTISDPAESFKAQTYAVGAIRDLGQQVEDNVKAAEPEKHGIIDKVLTMLHEQRSSDLTDQSVHLIQAMQKTGITTQQLVYKYLLPVSAAVVISQARAFADCIDFLLDRDEVVKTIQALAAKDTDSADAEIEHHMLEALRLGSTTNVYVSLSNNVKVNEGGKSIEVPANQRVICDTVSYALLTVQEIVTDMCNSGQPAMTLQCSPMPTNTTQSVALMLTCQAFRPCHQCTQGRSWVDQLLSACSKPFCDYPTSGEPKVRLAE